MTILLHGFWNSPRDWNQVLQKLPLGGPVLAPDLYAPGDLSPVHELGKWAENFWKWVALEYGEGPVQLVGYSMGARLAIAAVALYPERVSRALFLSGNPLFPANEFAAREEMEKDFAARFLSEDWAALETAWEDQPVFRATERLERRKTPEMREVLGLSLTRWSPRLHPFTFEDVKSLPSRMEWAFGALDQKYLGIAKSLQELPVQGQISIIPEAGHRLIVEAAGWISDWIVRKT